MYNVEAESEGEELVIEALKELGLEYGRGKLTGLKNDTKKFRIPDFSLIQFKPKIHIEFLGGLESWNTETREKERARYDDKKRVFNDKANNVQCIYLYPRDKRDMKKAIMEGLKLLGVSNEILEEITENE